MQHPIDFQQLPEAARKVLGGAPPLKMMAARGVAPIPPAVLVAALYGLSYDADEKLRESARATLGKLAEPIVQAAFSGELHAAVLDALATYNRGQEALLERVVQHPNVAGETLAGIARTASERLCERIATNEARLLEHPEIIKSLYLNEHCRMSTTDRLMELAARNNVRVDLPQFEAIVSALSEQLVMAEPTDEPLPGDDDFAAALSESADGTADDILEDDEGQMTLNQRAERAAKRLDEMTVTERIRTAMLGNGTQRAILVRSSNRLVCAAVLDSPKITEDEVIKYAASRQVGEEILRRIAMRREWFRMYDVKRNLVFNPKTPVAESLKILQHLMPQDVKKIKESKNVPAGLRTAAQALLNKRKG
ncbi:MAG: hypothetical protein JNK72_26110 [Myxococcales bacterium]|nr:hypothetical protein [Myxococcales bacterium]